jgi:putative DeoR family transcriptional regulator (stage III sporulation protein D)
MNTYIETRVKEVGSYILSTHSTIRTTAKQFGVSKSTIAKDLERLEKVNPQLLDSVREVVEDNKAQRHIRGGIATKMHYAKS